MQYKIPVQIENEDPIIFNLSLKQLAIIMGGFGVAYGIYNSLLPYGEDIALIPTIIIAILAILIAIFKQHEMTFLPFLLAILRFNINFKERRWIQGVDSFSPLQIGNIFINEKNDENKINFDSKIEKIKNLEESINKI
ncbi:MAG: PrgI family protein [Candidatus Gracilibacteria bacterium]|nr:PrgI family protein [Candidatus Gracilibacteria bacterium]